MERGRGGEKVREGGEGETEKKRKGRKEAEMRDSRAQRHRDGVWGRGKLSSSGAKNFLWDQWGL